MTWWQRNARREPGRLPKCDGTLSVSEARGAGKGKPMKIRHMFDLSTLTTKVGSDDEPKPVCPHCSGVVDSVVSYRSDYVGLLNICVFACPHCRKVLGVTTVGK